MPLNPTNPSPDDIHILNDSTGTDRQEVWSDGEWVRLGRDVLGDRYFEIKFEDFREFIDTLRAQSGVEKHTVQDSQGASKTLIVDAGYSLDIYRSQRHILYHNEHEYGVLSSAFAHAYEYRETFDYETLAESYVDAITPPHWEIGELSTCGRARFTAEVYSEGRHVRFPFVQSLRESPHVEFEQPGSVYYDGEKMAYQFRVDAKDLPGAPDDTNFS